MSLSLIVFDCDGIILESVDCKTRAFAAVGKDFGPAATDLLVLYHKMHGGVSRFIKFDWLFQRLFNREITKEEAIALNQKYMTACLDELLNCPLVPGVLEVLQTWQGRIPMYVASGAPHDELNDVLTHKKLASYFTKIYGSPPGKTQLLKNIIKEAGVAASETIMVGDSCTDLEAAEAVGCYFYGRGEHFSTTKYPWHSDLTLLNDHLNHLAEVNKIENKESQSDTGL